MPRAGVTITCEKAVQTGTSNEIHGAGIQPGYGIATLLYEKCSTSATCRAFNVGTENIQVEVNFELAYETHEAALKHEEPVGVIFRTKANGVAEFVKVKFAGTGCPLETTVNATGNAIGSIAGRAGVFCKIEAIASREKLVHELNCPLAAAKKRGTTSVKHSQNTQSVSKLSASKRRRSGRPQPKSNYSEYRNTR